MILIYLRIVYSEHNYVCRAIGQMGSCNGLGHRRKNRYVD